MKTKEDLQHLFENRFNPDKWKEFLNSAFNNVEIFSTPVDYTKESDLAEKILQIGKIKLDDGKEISIYEVKIKKKVQLDRNRVGLRSILAAHYRSIDGAFVVYHNNEHFPKWRFTFVSVYTGWNEKGEAVKISTEPKRYTYVLGEGETVRTPAERFYKIFDDKKVTIGEIIEAFSVEGVTDEFYSELRKVYDEIQGYIENIDKEKKKIFAQLLINRLIFLKFLEKKGWLFINEDDSLEDRRKYFRVKLEALGAQNQWKTFFVHLFFKGLNRQSVAGKTELTDAMRKIIGYVPYLNGGLFEESKLWNEYKVEIDNMLFFHIFERLLNRFNFTVAENTPLDIEVALNPDLLGYAYEEMIAERHGQGAYYTHPTEVGLMCRESLKTYLDEQLDINYDKLIDLIDEWNSDSLTQAEALLIYEKLLTVRILDPAVGSGAYPVRMMQELVQIYSVLSEKLSKGDLSKIIKNKLVDPRSFYDLKRSIIENNLYGVDIDNFAVEIAKLRFWLSLVVDYNLEVNTAKDLKLIPPLPNLDFKLKAGDSLLSVPGKVKQKNMFGEDEVYVNIDLYLMDETIGDFFSGEIIKELRELKTTYFNFEKERSKNEELFKLSKDELREQIAQKEKEIFASMGFKLEEDPESMKHIVWQVHFAELFDGENHGFDICIANPPYLRQEKINEMFEVFKSGVTKDDLVRAYEKIYEDLKLKIDKKSDLYVYFYLRALYLLKEKGVLCFICSNSWLDVGYGRCLQEVLLRKSRIKAIYDNSAKRSFAKADVNTTINVFVKDSSVNFAKNQRKLQTDNIVKFVSFKKDFEIAAIPDSFIEIKNNNEIIINSNFRSYAIEQKELMQIGLSENNKYEGDKWGGKYIKAPDIFFSILKKGGEKFVKLGDISEVKRGLTSGANDFFYLNQEMLSYWKIEEEYLRTIIKSPRECKKIFIDENDLKFKVFICNKEKDELRGTNALKYIEWGESQNFNNNETVRPRKLWYSCNGDILGNTFWVKETNDRLGAFLSDHSMLSDCRLYFANCDMNLRNLVNSTISGLFSEVMSRSGLGEGARSLMVYEVNNFMVLNPELFNLSNIIFEQRPLFDIFVECGFNKNKALRSQKPNPLPDRKELDDIVFDAIGLTQEERDEVYWSVCELVQNRLNKAKSV